MGWKHEIDLIFLFFHHCMELECALFSSSKKLRRKIPIHPWIDAKPIWKPKAYERDEKWRIQKLKLIEFLSTLMN